MFVRKEVIRLDEAWWTGGNKDSSYIYLFQYGEPVFIMGYCNPSFRVLTFRSVVQMWTKSHWNTNRFEEIVVYGDRWTVQSLFISKWWFLNEKMRKITWDSGTFFSSSESESIRTSAGAYILRFCPATPEPPEPPDPPNPPPNHRVWFLERDGSKFFDLASCSFFNPTSTSLSPNKPFQIFSWIEMLYPRMKTHWFSIGFDSGSLSPRTWVLGPISPCTSRRIWPSRRRRFCLFLPLLPWSRLGPPRPPTAVWPCRFETNWVWWPSNRRGPMRTVAGLLVSQWYTKEALPRTTSAAVKFRRTAVLLDSSLYDAIPQETALSQPVTSMIEPFATSLPNSSIACLYQLTPLLIA